MSAAEATTTTTPTAPARLVVQADALAWMAGPRAELSGRRAAVVTSLPDLSEIGVDVPGYEAFMARAVPLVLSLVPDDGVALFFQTDIKREGRQVDKGFLVTQAARGAGAQVLFHKVICRVPAGTRTFGRPAFTHLLCFSKAGRAPDDTGIPDVVTDAGRQIWARAMGLRACAAAVAYVAKHDAADVVVDPFCGRGTVLAVAGALGRDALGIERSPKRCEQARALQVHASDL